MPIASKMLLICEEEATAQKRSCEAFDTVREREERLVQNDARVEKAVWWCGRDRLGLGVGRTCGSALGPGCGSEIDFSPCFSTT